MRFFESFNSLVCFIFACVLMQIACKDSLEEITDPKTEVPQSKSKHPFLIVKKEDFDLHRAKATQEPWASMKADAIQRSAAGSSNSAYKLQEYIGAAALAYILDEDQSALHAGRVRDAIIDQYSKLEVIDGQGWRGVVPNMGSFYMAILSLDIVYDALSVEDVAQCEQVIESQIFKIERSGSWLDVRLGTHGTWDIYKGIRTTPDDEYYEGIMHQITPDGVSPVTIHYAWERVGGGDSRLSKAGYMDVLEYTGIDRRYYNNERLIKFQRWLFGSSINCNREMAIIGDMLPTQSIHNDMLHRRVVNFDEEAASYAAWLHKGVKAKGTILTYLLPKEALPAPQEPTSQLFTNGGAFLRESGVGRDGLHAVLYNITSQDEWHTHQEVNGLALSGFGNRLLVNGGRLGSPVRAASLNNTLTIEGNQHRSRLGGGVVEGFTTPKLDYAVGSSGQALTGANHLRSIVLLHSDDVKSRSYVIIHDKVNAEMGGNVVNYFHPANQSDVKIVQEQIAYTAVIDHYPTVNGTSLGFYFLTPPNSVGIGLVASAVPDRYPDYPDHNRIASRYQVDSDQGLGMITLLLPCNEEQAFPVIERTESDSYIGAAIPLENGLSDRIVEGSTDELIVTPHFEFQGDWFVARVQEDDLHFYFAESSSRLEYRDMSFDSDTPISIFYNGQEGVILSQGTTMTLRGKDVENLQFSELAEVLDSGVGVVELRIKPGKVQFSK